MLKNGAGEDPGRSRGGAGEHRVGSDVKTCMGLYVGAGSREKPISCISALSVFSWRAVSLTVCLFQSPPPPAPMNFPCAQNQWCLVLASRRLLYTTLSTKGEAFGRLLPIMPVFFFRLSTNPSLFQHHPGVQDRHWME